MFTYRDAYEARYYFEKLRIQNAFRFHWHYNILEATLKNAYIAQRIEEEASAKQILNILDMGCGNGHVSHWIVKLAKTNTLGFDPSISYRDFLSNTKINLQNRFGGVKVKSKLVRTNHLGFFARNKSKFDIIIDNCSVTHFDTKPNLNVNNGWLMVIEKSREILNSSGKFIVATDVCGKGNPNAEFVNQIELVNAFENLGWRITKRDQIISSCSDEWSMLLGDVGKYEYLRVPPIGTLTKSLMGITGFVAHL